MMERRHSGLHDKKLELKGIRNLVHVEGAFVTAGQPSEEHLRELAAAGFDAVVNLGLLDLKYCLPDEEGSVEALGMAYYHIPVNFQNPSIEGFNRFREIMKALSNQTVFVHCAMNYRVACFTALYCEAELGWSREHADNHIRRVWEPDEAWNVFLERVRAKLSTSKWPAAY